MGGPLYFNVARKRRWVNLQCIRPATYTSRYVYVEMIPTSEQSDAHQLHVQNQVWSAVESQCHA